MRGKGPNLYNLDLVCGYGLSLGRGHDLGFIQSVREELS